MSRTESDETLADVLAALASPNRLAMLRQLRAPKTAREVHLTPEAPKEGDRLIARQAVRAHLEKLMEAGVVVSRRGEREAREAIEYIVNHARLFGVSEAVRELATLRPLTELAPEVTREDVPRRGPHAIFPRLLVVRGLNEGQSFAVRPFDGEKEASWLIGRKPGVAIWLDYDPFVSLENTRFSCHEGQYGVESLPTSRNGTTLNLQPIVRGAPQPVYHGDVVGVGRTLLLFQTHTGRGPRG